MKYFRLHRHRYYRINDYSSFRLHLNRARVAIMLGLFFRTILGVNAAFASPAQVEKLISTQIKAAERDNLSISVVDVESSRSVFELNGDQPRIPASVLKTVTTVAALEDLGAHYRFDTQFFTAPHLTSRSSSGNGERKTASPPDLYVHGGGDPSLLSSKLYEIAEQIKATGHAAFSDIVIDDSAFIHPRGALGSNPYQAALSATSLDQNCYRLFVTPGDDPGQPAFAMLSLGSTYRLVNRVRTVKGEGKELTWEQSTAPSSDAEITVTVSGVIGQNAAPHVEYLTVPTPFGYFGDVLRDTLTRVGIEVHGAVRQGVTPGGSKLLLKFDSKDLALILYDLNHYSSNFMAEQIVYALGEEGGVFDHDRGVQKLEKLLQRIGVPDTQYKLSDGSGLDRSNRITTSALVRTLVYAYQKLGLGPDLLASFSRFGATGTLKKRSVGEPKASLTAPTGTLSERSAGVWGKTGSLDGVSSVVGLLEDSSHRRLAYAIISNGFVSKELEDRIISTLLGE